MHLNVYGDGLSGHLILLIQCILVEKFIGQNAGRDLSPFDLRIINSSVVIVMLDHN